MTIRVMEFPSMLSWKAIVIEAEPEAMPRSMAMPSPMPA